MSPRSEPGGLRPGRLWIACCVALAAGCGACGESRREPPDNAIATPAPKAIDTLVPTAGRPAAEVSDAALAEALEALSTELDLVSTSDCGPYRVLSAARAEYLETCRAIARELDRIYGERLGVDPVHAPDGLIVLFGSTADFTDYARRIGRLRAGYAGFSRASRGIVAVNTDGVPLDRFATVLAHELAHLVHRRVFGSRLPPWLSEGLADAIGDTATADGIAELEGLAGAEALADRLRLAIRAERAEPAWVVTVKSRAQFDRGTVSYDYETSALLVRFLLVDDRLGGRFRSVLAMLANGEECDLPCLLGVLEVDGAELDLRFRRWLGVSGRAADS